MARYREYSDYGSYGGEEHTVGAAIGGFVLVVFLLFVIAAIVIGFELFREASAIKEEATDTLAQVSVLKDELGQGDFQSATTTAAWISEHADSMREGTEGWVWQVCAHVPVIKDDVVNVQTLTTVFDTLSDSVIDPVVQAGVSGDVAALATAAADANGQVEQAKATLDALPPSHFSQISNAVSRAEEALDEVSAYTSNAANAVQAAQAAQEAATATTQ